MNQDHGYREAMSGRDSSPAIMWFRQDLRLADNPALLASAAGGRPVVCLYVLDEAGEGDWPAGGASRWWLHMSLAALAESLERLGQRLVLRRGPALAALREVVSETGAGAVVWNRRYEPAAATRDARVKAELKAAGVAAESFNAALLFEPWTIRTGGGGPYKVFTPFWRACLGAPAPPAPLAPPASIAAPPAWPAGEALDDWRLLPRAPDWAGGLRRAWTPGEAGAQARLQRFLSEGLEGYAAARDRPDLPATSRLSPHLHFGEIGPRQVFAAVQALGAGSPGAEKFLQELGWREFCHHLLFHFPALPAANFRAEFDAFPWADDPAGLDAWRRGRTGYPIVDAGMAELWTTGWMHNRVRMIAASFLIKHLLIDWRQGEAWFWDTLVDADLANNAASWQWVAGGGADAAPYFRIFNPVAQGEKFDPNGTYVRRWVPELARLPAAWLHKPWDAPAAVLAGAGVRLGTDYPRPIVDHAKARKRALDAFAAMKDRPGAA
ncbi:deoxyribodipyrimidine photo-lyase [Phenylobacterium sp.]|uniref:cryptochrome/photolyase family protein n=1 Tax=Phenylobacterium sp. TaxID=1871053 RepID=UPI0035B35BE2